jgi:hypothetical protein
MCHASMPFYDLALLELSGHLKPGQPDSRLGKYGSHVPQSSQRGDRAGQETWRNFRDWLIAGTIQERRRMGERGFKGSTYGDSRRQE